MSLNSNLLGQTYEQIQKAVLGGGNVYFQMFGEPMDFSWPLPPTGQMAPQAYQIISTMPLWSPVGSYSMTDVRFADAFRRLLQYVVWNASPEVQQSWKNQQDVVTALSNRVTQDNSDMNTTYQTEKQNGGPVFAARYPDIDTWLAKAPEAQEWINKIDQDTQAWKVAQDQLLDLQKSAMPNELQAMIDAIKVPSGDPASSPAPRGWTKVPDGSGIIRWEPSYTIGATGQDWRASLTSGTQGSFEVKLDASKSSSAITQSWAGANAEYSEVFWSVNVGGSWKSLNISKDDQSVTATISVKSSTFVPVTPGDWYDGGFVKALALNEGGAGYILQSPWTPTGSANAAFGANGLLSSMVSGLVVVYQPSFEITMSESTFNQVQQQISASAGLRIGPFTFGGNGGHTSDYQVSTSGSTSFKGGSTSTDPLIIGITVAFPGVEHP